VVGFFRIVEVVGVVYGYTVVEVEGVQDDLVGWVGYI